MTSSAAARHAACALVLIGALFSRDPLRAEVLEEIVVKVNDEIITKTDLENEEQAMTAELYRSFSGPDLDRRLAEGKSILLRRLIDRRLMMQRAERMLLLGIASILDPWLSGVVSREPGTITAYAVAIIAVGTLWTSGHRTVWIARALKGK